MGGLPELKISLLEKSQSTCSVRRLYYLLIPKGKKQISSTIKLQSNENKHHHRQGKADY